MRLVDAAMTGRAAGLAETASGAFAASRWYETAVLPGLAGILVGLAMGFAVRPRPAEALLGGLLFGLCVLLFRGSPPIESWLAPLFFTFCSTGASHIMADFRERPRHGAVN